MKRLLIATLLGILLPLATHASKPLGTQTITLQGVTSPEDFYVPIYTSFTVPKGIVKISVEQRLFTPNGRCNLDLGIFDPRGAGFGTPGFRGWSGGARRSFEIGEREATPGYLAGAIQPGEWTVIQMPTTPGYSTEWTLEITLTEGHTSCQKPTAVYAATQLNDSPGWYRIAPHVHTEHSDGRLTQAQIVTLAKASGLDGIISTDHNTTSALRCWGAVQDSSLLVINGMEVTYCQGHWNVLGLAPEAWVDFRFHSTDTLRYRQALRQARRAGKLLIANHPYNLDFLHDITPMDGIEVWNSAWSPANERAVALWHSLLVAGNRKFAVASTDFHRGDNIASPLTVVRAEGLSAASVLEGLAAGRAYLAKEPAIDIGMTAYCPSAPATCAELGDTLLRRGEVTIVFRTNTPGQLRLIDQQGDILTKELSGLGTDRIPIPERSLWVRAELRTPQGEMLALTNPIFLQHPLTTRELLPEIR